MRINCLSELVLFVSVLACGVQSAPLIDAVNANRTIRLFEGDIAGFHRSSSNDTEKTLALLIDDSVKLWENGIVYYTIAEEDYNDQGLKEILKGMKMIEDQTRVNGKDCIKFQERNSEDSYLYIFSGAGCYSMVGRDVGEPQGLSLEADGCDDASIAAHELLHALGFMHEQNRPDRDEFITVVWDNIYEDDKYLFEKYTEGTDTLGLTYDYASIMHYSEYAGAIDDSKPTMVPTKPGVVFPEMNKLSELDVESVRKYYGCI